MFSRVGTIIVVLVLGVVSVGSFYWYQENKAAQLAAAAEAAAAFKTPEEAESVFVRFDMEVFDVITENYWQKPAENELADLFRLAFQKVNGDREVVLPEATRAGLAQMLAREFALIPEENRKAIAHDTALIVLVNLAPQGRNNLLSEKQEAAFRDVVNNVDRDINLYDTLGLADGASIEEVATAYEAKKTEIEASDAGDKETQLAEVERAHQVLAQENSKAVYDEAKIEPSLVSRTINDHILYVDLAQVTAATFQEFVYALVSTGERPELDGLILDFRGNLGGTLDFAKYLLALFVGPNQYAFDLFHQGELLVERTPQMAPIPALSKLVDVALLTDGETRSTGELTTSMFKRFNLAVVVGTKTKGWGSVENTFPLSTQFDESEKYTVLLVHSLMVREDGNPIEANGVEPDVSIDFPIWKQQVRERFHARDFAETVIALLRE